MPFQRGNQLAVGNRNAHRHKQFRKALNRVIAYDDTILTSIAAKLVEMALDGNMRAIREIADRLDGKPSQEHHHPVSGDTSQPIVVRWATGQA